MTDDVFKSNLSVEEIEKNFEDADFFEGVKSGLEEALVFEKGKADTFVISEKPAL